MESIDDNGAKQYDKDEEKWEKSDNIKKIIQTKRNRFIHVNWCGGKRPMHLEGEHIYLRNALTIKRMSIHIHYKGEKRKQNNWMSVAWFDWLRWNKEDQLLFIALYRRFLLCSSIRDSNSRVFFLPTRTSGTIPLWLKSWCPYDERNMDEQSQILWAILYCVCLFRAKC